MKSWKRIQYRRKVPMKRDIFHQMFTRLLNLLLVTGRDGSNTLFPWLLHRFIVTMRDGDNTLVMIPQLIDVAGDGCADDILLELEVHCFKSDRVTESRGQGGCGDLTLTLAYYPAGFAGLYPKLGNCADDAVLYSKVGVCPDSSKVEK